MTILALEHTADGKPWRVMSMHKRKSSVFLFLVCTGLAWSVCLNSMTEEMNSTRLGVGILLAMVASGLFFRLRWIFLREAKIYLVLVAIMALSLLWAPDPRLGLNSVSPAICSLLLLIAIPSALHWGGFRPVIAGFAAGCVAGLVTHFTMYQFPLVLLNNDEQSYNAVALIFSFCLWMVLFWGVLGGRWWLVLPVVCWCLLGVLITASKKTNFGIALGVIAWIIVSLDPRRRRPKSASYQSKPSRRSVVLSIICAMATCIWLFAGERGEYFWEEIQNSFIHFDIGARAVQANMETPGVDVPGYGGRLRIEWIVSAWTGVWDAPILGHGAEAFRAQEGITGHSALADIPFNHGLLGLVLCIAVLASLGLRAFDWRMPHTKLLRGIVIAGTTMYAFASLTGNIYYLPVCAMFVGTSSGLLGELAGPHMRARRSHPQ